MTPLQWHEPSAYRCALARQNKRERFWGSLKFVAFIFIVMIGVRAMGESGSSHPRLPGWLPTLLIASGVAVLLAFVLPWLLLRLPSSIIILSEKGVNNNLIGPGVKIYFWTWAEITSCSVSAVTIGERSFRTFGLHGANGQVLATFGVGDKPTAEEIEQYLNFYGPPLRIVADLHGLE